MAYSNKVKNYLRIKRDPASGVAKAIDELESKLGSEIAKLSKIEERMVNNPGLIAKVMEASTVLIKSLMPTKGKDYYTEFEKSELVKEIQSKIVTREEKAREERASLAGRIEALKQEIASEIEKESKSRSESNSKMSDENIKALKKEKVERQKELALLEEKVKELELQGKPLSKNDIQAIVSAEVSLLFSEKPKGAKKITREEVKDLIKKVQVDVDYSKITRGIEALPEKEKLDFWKGLKNQPDFLTKEGISRIGGRGFILTVEEADGDPSVSEVKKIVVSNGTLTDDGNGQVTISTGGGGSGDVTSSANITDHAIVRGDGGAKGVQDSGILIDDSDNISGINNVTGSDTDLVTGTAGTDGHILTWDANGNAQDSGFASSNLITASSTTTFTNKTLDANGTGNSISNIEVADFAGSAIITESEDIDANDSDTALTTSAAVIDYNTRHGYTANTVNTGTRSASNTTELVGGTVTVDGTHVVENSSDGKLRTVTAGTYLVILTANCAEVPASGYEEMAVRLMLNGSANGVDHYLAITQSSIYFDVVRTSATICRIQSFSANDIIHGQIEDTVVNNAGDLDVDYTLAIKYLGA